MEHPSRRAGVRVRDDRSDGRQRPRPEDHVVVRRRRAARAVDRRPRRLRARARPATRHGQSRADVAHRRRQARARHVTAPRVAGAPPRGGDPLRGHDGDAARRRSSSPRGLLNRQDAEFEARPGAFTESVGSNPERDPRRHRTFNHRVLQPRLHSADDRQMVLGFQCTNSKMSLACAARHHVETTAMFDVDIEISPDEATAFVSSMLAAGQSVTVTKFVSYHTSRYAPTLDAEVVDDAFELATRCTRSLDRVEHDGYPALVSAQEAWLDQFWSSSDVEVRHRPVAGRSLEENAVAEVAEQQAMRWNLFQLAQASAQVGEQGIAAKGVTGGGYEGHYFWDTEMYVAPFLVVHAARGRPSADALPLAHAAGRPQPRRRPQPGRCPLPVAHDQRRGGIGVLRGRDGAVPHQRGDRLRPQALRRRQRRHHVPCHRWRRDARRDRPAVERPRLLLQPWGEQRKRRRRRVVVPHPRRHGTRRVHGGGQRQPVHQRDGALQSALRRPCARAARRVGARRLRRPGAAGRPRRGRGAGMGRGGRVDVPALRREPRHPPPGRRLPRPPGVGLRSHTGAEVSAAAALPPARHLPPSGAQAGRRRAGDVAAQRPVLARGAQAQLRLLRPHHHGRLLAVGVRPGGGRRPDRLRRPRRPTTSARRCSSTSPTSTATPATASTWRPPAGCGERWPSGSPGCTRPERR